MSKIQIKKAINPPSILIDFLTRCFDILKEKKFSSESDSCQNLFF